MSLSLLSPTTTEGLRIVALFRLWATALSSCWYTSQAPSRLKCSLQDAPPLFPKSLLHCYLMASDKLTLRSARDWVDWETQTKSELRKDSVWLVVAHERDSRAIGIIRSLMAPNLVIKYKSHNTSKGLWDALKADFSNANKTEIAYSTLMQLQKIKLRLGEGEDNVTLSVMQSHIDRYQSKLNYLESLGYPIHDDLQPPEPGGVIYNVL
ncbi:hypothetical protein B0H16DRAFT_1888282 [Mycena metata]|uniref:Uncharacterized protein n=1 Tax=Mycena metata TaxID=1033252 RepID=A0AAD7IRD0_9AGAR|nr:hypothetical protein B0H16DRAFT_1888282 [Mycena metata]